MSKASDDILILVSVSAGSLLRLSLHEFRVLRRKLHDRLRRPSYKRKVYYFWWDERKSAVLTEYIHFNGRVGAVTGWSRHLLQRDPHMVKAKATLRMEVMTPPRQLKGRRQTLLLNVLRSRTVVMTDPSTGFCQRGGGELDVEHLVLHVRMHTVVELRSIRVECRFLGVPTDMDIVDIADIIASAISGKVCIVHRCTNAC